MNTPKERPILFSPPMIRAILDGCKTQTRRIVKCKGFDLSEYEFSHLYDEPRGILQAAFKKGESTISFPCPYGQPGDRLWVRETFAYDVAEHPPYDVSGNPTCSEAFTYKADDDIESIGWTPSIHMPRRASRIDLEITGIHVERLNKISRGDAMGEGCPFPNMQQGPNPKDWFADLWKSLHGPESWAENPWVWVVEFWRIKP